MDVVLFENEICPEFAINNDPASTYYPCEGVIAVGEIKTAIDSRELEDIFKKVQSVKELRRFVRPSPSGTPRMEDYVAFRKYGSLISAATPKPGDYNQDMHLLTRYTDLLSPVVWTCPVKRYAASSQNLPYPTVTHSVPTWWSHSMGPYFAHYLSLLTVTILLSLCQHRRLTISTRSVIQTGAFLSFLRDCRPCTLLGGQSMRAPLTGILLRRAFLRFRPTA